MCPFLFTLLWWGFNRLSSRENRIRVVHAAERTAVEHSSGNELRIAIYNIAHGRGAGSNNWTDESPETRLRRLHEIGAFLKTLNADMIVLNEVDFDSSWSHRVNQAEVIAEITEMPHRVEQRNVDLSLPFFRWRFGNAVLSRHPLEDARLIDYPAFSTWESWLAGKKRGVVMDVGLADGPDIRLIAVHLEHRDSPTRLKSARLIQKTADDGTITIAAGDFNSTPSHFPRDPNDTIGNQALDWLVSDGGFTTLPNGVPKTEELTFSSTTPRQRIDWVMVNGAAQPVSQQTFPVMHSDHRPVISVVRW